MLRREEVQLLTLTGPGGTGKTRLALQGAAELLDDFADGVYFVPLAALTDPTRVPDAIALALGLREEGDQPLLDRLARYLTAKEMLLVLDNVEHLIEAAPLVGSLLEGAPGLTVLATSRVPLRVRAEREYPVPPLGLPRRKPPPTLEQLSQYEAVRLFIERAQAVKPDFAVDNETAPAVAEICHRLDGLPLAIELAAARIRMLSPPAMLRRLEQRLTLLTGGARDAPARQRTLRDTIAWSYDLLKQDEQRLFRRLAVFAGGASFEAIEVVANPNGDLEIFGGLEGLVEHNLLRQIEDPSGEPRFSMLETIREFGLEQLEAKGEAEGTLQSDTSTTSWLWPNGLRHTPCRAQQQRTWLDRLDTEHDNLRVALGRALEQYDGAGCAQACGRPVPVLVRGAAMSARGAIGWSRRSLSTAMNQPWSGRGRCWAPAYWRRTRETWKRRKPTLNKASSSRRRCGPGDCCRRMASPGQRDRRRRLSRPGHGPLCAGARTASGTGRRLGGRPHVDKPRAGRHRAR